MKRVLVIGNSSYIGRNLMNYIEKMDDISIIVDGISGKDEVWKNKDFTVYDTVILLSAIVHRNEKKVDENLYMTINYALALDISNECKVSGVQHFIFMSTASVYNSNMERIDILTKPNPKTIYGKSKLMAEREILQLEDENFKVCIVRPPMVYGDGCKGNYRLLSKVAKYSPIFFDSKNKRSVIHITNLSKYLVSVIENRRDGINHPQDSEYRSTYALYSNIRYTVHKKTIRIYIPRVVHRILNNRCSIYRKIFGDMYYSKELR